ncbi:hypothetical protein GCK32_003941 [Trichostrongylus colubriformis]|uniref:Uncharacterized protein n=1 Tax=Trichostrongylus colubriformis TaxID=6319 RepID=A0AAN8FAV9_TRICO
MLMDMAAYLVVVIHDLPSLHLNVNLFSGTYVNNFFVLIMFVQFYTQLFVLLVLSIIHAVAVFYPAKFRAFSSKNVQMIDVIIVVVAVVGSVPIFTVYCDFIYSVNDLTWTLDIKKPCTKIYHGYGLLLQEVRVSNEVQLAFNFILLSACYLIMAIIFYTNVGALLYGSMYNVARNLNNAKWSLYVLGNKTIRRKLLSLLPCC